MTSDEHEVDVLYVEDAEYAAACVVGALEGQIENRLQYIGQPDVPGEAWDRFRMTIQAAILKHRAILVEHIR